jgi:hypothetical protein
LLTVQVASSPRPLPPEHITLGESVWSGISGAPVVADGCLLGVVTEQAAREGPSAITVVPLSALEADPAHPGWGPGVSNANEWWARMGTVAGLAGLRRLPSREERPRPAYLATVREIHTRTPELLGRERELADLAAFATGTQGYLWLQGPAWAGKTALVAEAVTTALPPTVDVAVYFLSRRNADADCNRFLAAVVPQLAYLLERNPPVPDVHEFRALWDSAAERATATGRHLLLVVDGIDEDLHPPGVPSVASLLPSKAGGNTHVLVTSRPDSGVPRDIPLKHPLRQTQPVPLEPPEYATELVRLAGQEIHDLLNREDQDLAADVLGVLAAAAGPLSIDDLATLIADSAPASAAWSRRISRFVTEEAARSLQPVGPADHRRYQFAHASLLEQAQADRNLDRPDYRRRIDRWADQWREAGWPTPAGEDGMTPRYLLDEYPATLRNQPQRLMALATDIGWVTAAVQTVGVNQVVATFAAAEAVAESPADVSALLATLQALRPPQPNDQPDYVLRQLSLLAVDLGIRGSIASLTGEAGDPAGALQLFRELLPDTMRVLGPDHPNVLGIRGSIASLTMQTDEA